MPRYVLIAAGSTETPADPHVVLNRLGAELLDETPSRAFLVEADKAIVGSIRAALPGWKIHPEVAHPLPGPARARSASVPFLPVAAASGRR